MNEYAIDDFGFSIIGLLVFELFEQSVGRETADLKLYGAVMHKT